MKIAILGCGAIGGMFLGRLAKKKHDVIGIVKDYQKESLLENGLTISAADGNQNIKVKVDTELKESVDLAIFATKINSLEEVISVNKQYLKEATLVTTQNGIQADYILCQYFDKSNIVTGIVMFGATFCAPDKVVHNFGEGLILGNIFNSDTEKTGKAKDILKDVFDTSILENIKGAKYLKLFINLNNCIPAILGLSMQEVFSDLEIARVAIELNKEAYQIITKSGIQLQSLPTYPKERIEGFVSMDIAQASALFSKIMTSLSKEPLYGSILQSIKRSKKSEIDYINGEIVSLADKNNLDAPLNKKVVEAVKKVETSGNFFKKDDFFKYLNN